MIEDVIISTSDWLAASKAMTEMGVRVLGMDMTPVARAIATARAEGYDEARMNFEEHA